MTHHKRLGAARRRRDEGERPLPADNEELAAVGEAINPLRVKNPVQPALGSRPHAVLDLMRRHESSSIEAIAKTLRCSERQTRLAIDTLRRMAHDIRNVDYCEFALRPPSSRAAV